MAKASSRGVGREAGKGPNIKQNRTILWSSSAVMPREDTHLELMLARSKVHSLIQDVNAPTGATQTGFQHICA